MCSKLSFFTRKKYNHIFFGVFSCNFLLFSHSKLIYFSLFRSNSCFNFQRQLKSPFICQIRQYLKGRISGSLKRKTFLLFSFVTVVNHFVNYKEWDRNFLPKRQKAKCMKSKWKALSPWRSRDENPHWPLNPRQQAKTLLTILCWDETYSQYTSHKYLFEAVIL